jgi:hypothetical protein
MNPAPIAEPKSIGGVRVELPTEIRALLARRDREASERERIDAALANARRELSALTTEQAEAGARLSSIEAEAAIAGGQPNQAARTAVLSLRDHAEVLKAKVAGLESRSQVARDTAVATSLEVADLAIAWQRAIATAILAEYDAAVVAFVGVLNQVRAAGLALEAPANKPLLLLGHSTTVTAAHGHVNLGDARRGAYKDDPVAMELNAAIASVRALMTAPSNAGQHENREPVEAVA